MTAIRRRPEQTDRTAPRDGLNIDLPNILSKMPGTWMVSQVHGDRVLIMVDGIIRGTAKGHFDPVTGSAATRENVNYHLTGETCGSLRETEMKLFHGRHPGAFLVPMVGLGALK